MEVLRDQGAQHSWNDAQRTHVHRYTVLHEIGHQFLGPAHTNTGLAEPQDVMWAASPDGKEKKRISARECLCVSRKQTSLPFGALINHKEGSP